MSKIMIVEDDPNIRELVCTLLKHGGFEAATAKDGRDALLKMSEVDPDMCIVDLMMPNMDGYEFCRKIRQYYENMPIIMLTAKSDILSKSKGYDAGTDDYLTKPFEGDELLMRVRALLRRYKIEAAQVIAIGNITIDKNGLTVNGEIIPMKEFELLFKLASFPGRIFSRDQLIEDIWGCDFDGNERTLDVHIGRLRERYAQDTSGFKITTLRGLGYKLEVVS